MHRLAPNRRAIGRADLEVPAGMQRGMTEQHELFLPVSGNVKRPY